EVIAKTLTEVFRQVREFGVDVLFQFFARLGELLFELDAAGHARGIFDKRQVVRAFGAGENSVKSIVVSLRNRIILVVVTASAGDGQGEKSASGGVDLVIDLVMRIIVEHSTEREKTQSRQAPRWHSRTLQIGCQLILHKLIERQVLVK